MEKRNPNDLLILLPFTTNQPCPKIFFGNGRPKAIRIAGQIIE